MAKFVQDPLVNKRKATEAHLEVDKKARVVEATSIEDQVALMHAPYAVMPTKLMMEKLSENRAS